MKKCFISGMVSNDRHYKAKFRRAEKLLSKRGYVVINPTVLPLGMFYDDYIHICYGMIDVCDVFVRLPDANDSIGAMKELAYVMSKTDRYREVTTLENLIG